MNRVVRIFSILSLLLMVYSPAAGLNILITNDDGYNSPNIQALYAALKAEGHDVLISAPLKNQSGTSASMAWFVKSEPFADPKNKDIHWVDGSPAVSVLYGIDILSLSRWGRYPDLVISGPNIGHNTGILITHSGTIGATITALYRGIPSVAVSADMGSGKDGTHHKIAMTTVKLITRLTRENRPVLSPGTGINLNIPSLTNIENIDELEFVFSSIGTSATYIPRFTMSLGEDPMGKSSLSDPSKHIGIPGITVTSPKQVNSLKETATDAETQLLQKGKATISVINVTYAASPSQEQKARSRLQQLVKHRNN